MTMKATNPFRFQKYSQEETDGSVSLIEDAVFDVRAGTTHKRVNGSVNLSWSPSLRINFHIRIPREEIDSDEFGDLCSEVPEVGLRGFDGPGNLLVQRATMDTLDPEYPLRVRASANRVEAKIGERLSAVHFQVANSLDFSSLVGKPRSAVPGHPWATMRDLKEDMKNGVDIRAPEFSELYGCTLATVKLEYDGWEIDIVQVKDHTEATKRKKKSGYAFTHVGGMKRKDSSDFSVNEADGMLNSLFWFLSFIRGRHCGIPLVWGMNEGGDVVWRRFATTKVDEWTDSEESWFNTQNGEAMEVLFPKFCRTRKVIGEPFILSLAMYFASNRSKFMEGSFLAGMTVLDTMGAMLLEKRCGSGGGDFETLTTSDATQYAKTRSFRERMTTLLKEIGLDLDGGSVEDRLCRMDANKMVSIRNAFTHPYCREGGWRLHPIGAVKRDVNEARRLCLHLQELAFLRLLDYNGGYINRTVADDIEVIRNGGALKYEWHQHSFQPVPWSKEWKGSSGS